MAVEPYTIHKVQVFFPLNICPRANVCVLRLKPICTFLHSYLVINREDWL